MPALGLHLLFFALFAWVLQSSAYELFVVEPGVHFPRVIFWFNADHPVDFIELWFNTPTVGPFIELITALIGIGLALLGTVRLFSISPPQEAKRRLRVMAFLFLVQFITMVAVLFDVLSSAGDFG